MGIDEILRSHRSEILRIAQRHGVRRIRVFGSVARGKAHRDSDVDLLIDSGPDRTPFFPGGLVADLEELLHRRVQVVTEQGLRPSVRDEVISEAVSL